MIKNALNLLSISTSVKIRVSSDDQGHMLAFLLKTVTLNNSFEESGDPRHLTISLEFHNITNVIFNPNNLPIADFSESLFGKEHVELASVTFEGSNFHCDKDYIPKLMNLRDIKIRNTNINLKNLKVKMDNIESLSISSSEIEFPSAATVFEKVPKLTLEN